MREESMNLEILVSCMNQGDMSIIKKLNIKRNALIINQCNCDDVYIDDKFNIKMISTKERGLSKSRNMAIQNSIGDICLLSDDDEYFFDNIDDLILNSYKKYEADIIIFDLQNYHKSLKRNPHKLSRLELLKVSSVQISFKRNSVVDKINFDEHLGAGTYNGFGEENNFLLRAFDKGLAIFYVPLDLGILNTEGSTWFRGYSKDYFFKRGKISRYNLGFFLSSLYSLYFCLTKINLYKKNINFFNALKYSFRGCFTKSIDKRLED